MSARTRDLSLLLLRLAVAGATARALFLIGGYFLHYLDVRRHHIESSLFILAGAALTALLIRPACEQVPKFSQWPSRSIILVSALLVTFALYWPALHIGFLSDDFVLAHRAQRGEFVASSHEFVRPVPLVLWRLLFMVGAGAPAVHALNVLLHAVNGALTVGVARAIGLRRGPALMAGLLFLVWPTQVESVTWASGVFDVLATTLVLALATVYLRVSPGFTSSRWALMGVLTILALGTKETAAAIPALLLVISIPQWAERRPLRSELTALTALTGICAAYMVWRVLVRSAVSGAQHPVITLYAVKELLSRTFATLGVPFTTEWIENAAPLAAAFCAIVVLLAIVPIALAHQRGSAARHVIAALSWPLLAGAPAIGYLFIGPHLEGSRYLYLPMTGWAMFLAVTAEATSTTRRWLPPIVGVCAIAGITLSVVQARSLLADWSTAGKHRDAILIEAVRSADVRACDVAHFLGAPERYRGAQLFTNGLDEAVAAWRGSRRSGPRDQQRCEFSWDGQHFVPR